MPSKDSNVAPLGRKISRKKPTRAQLLDRGEKTADAFAHLVKEAPKRKKYTSVELLARGAKSAGNLARALIKARSDSFAEMEKEKETIASSDPCTALMDLEPDDHKNGSTGKISMRLRQYVDIMFHRGLPVGTSDFQQRQQMITCAWRACGKPIVLTHRDLRKEHWFVDPSQGLPTISYAWRDGWLDGAVRQIQYGILCGDPTHIELMKKHSADELSYDEPSGGPTSYFTISVVHAHAH